MPSDQPRLPFGLCAYGVPYLCGIAGAGTPLANPAPLSLLDLVDLAGDLRLTWLELPAHDGNVDALRARLAERGLRPVFAGARVEPESLAAQLPLAARLGASVLRCTLSGLLCGDRRSVGLSGWRELLALAARTLAELAPRAADLGLRFAVENHQDATSADLVWLCETVDHPAVGLTLDCGNALPVAEDPVEFALAVAPWVANVHLKDYRLTRSPAGFHLVHCPIGAGVVDFAAIWRALPETPRSIEMAALGERHVRMGEPEWWAAHEPGRTAGEAFERLLDERTEELDWRTPFDRGEAAGLADWERERLLASVANLTEIFRETTDE